MIFKYGLHLLTVLRNEHRNIEPVGSYFAFLQLGKTFSVIILSLIYYIRKMCVEQSR